MRSMEAQDPHAAFQSEPFGLGLHIGPLPVFSSETKFHWFKKKKKKSQKCLPVLQGKTQVQVQRAGCPRPGPVLCHSTWASQGTAPVPVLYKMSISLCQKPNIKLKSYNIK